ncbi:Hint domain-containing protein [Pseudorhodobacter ferrugineus]|uniref:Hint domain-containing protein n=1 Tax=Pseudorhodobacter ferrugineus TaxID=77008 RepID=UPI0003B5C0B5|nr:Hint domain-containing protein [Pseudorhodobacter ferrugineus]
MAAINTGLGGPQGVGEGSFRSSALTAGNYDDGSILVNITSVFGPNGINYFGTNYTSLYINTNGLITFNAPVTSYTPTALASVTYPAIAVFWSDVNITAGSGTGTNNIYWDLDPSTNRVTITWLGVRAYSGSTANTNTFQLVLEHTQNGNFEIDFIYQQIQWTNGYTGVAQTGLTNGGAIDYIIPGSGNAAAIANYPNAVLDPNDPNGVWSTRFLNGNPVCFVAGTMIATPDGERGVETLRAGDLVDTLDDGPQPLLWVGGGTVVAQDEALPVCISQGVLDNDADLWVSGQHLVMLDGADCELLFGEAEVLVAAKHLLGLPGVYRAIGTGKVSYHHLLLEQHQLVIAQGTAAETLYPGPQVFDALPHRAVDSLRAVLLDYEMERIGAKPAVRRVLLAHEAKVLIGRRLASAKINQPPNHCNRGALAA